MPRHGIRAKNALLEAGAQLLAEAPIHKTLRSITAREVARRAGKTTGSFYNYWPTQDDFCADLVDRVLRPDPSPQSDSGQLAEPSDESSLPAMLTAMFDQHVRVDQFRLYLVMAGFGNDTHVAAALQRRADELERRVVATVERTMSAEGLELREGLSASDLAMVLAALADGFGIRCAGNLDFGRERERFVAAASEIVAAATTGGDVQRWSARQSVG